MILYPLIAHWLSLTDIQSGALMGGSIHNVSQAVGAGYAVSGEAGDMSTIVKLIRVSALLPAIILISLFYGRDKTGSNSLSWKTYFPPFMIAFFLFALINFLNVLPQVAITGGVSLSEFFLVVSLVAIGINTNIRDIVTVGVKPMIAMLLTTLVMLVFVIVIVKALLMN